jgi:hypothetical protein
LGGVSLSFEDWLYRKSEQNAHSEIMAFLLVVLSVNLLLGGLVVTVLTVGQQTLLPFLVVQTSGASSVLGLILTVAGFCLLCLGFILVVYYDKERSWYLGEIDRSTQLKNRKVKVKTAHDVLEELVEGKKNE